MEFKKRLHEIDALRAVACVMVVFSHLGNHGALSQFGFSVGVMGVDLFFIISGFVIFLTIQNNSNWLSFLRNRFSRLFPTYWVCVTVTAIFLLCYNKLFNASEGPSLLGNAYLKNLTMLQYYFGSQNIDGSYWTLIIELLFYLLVVIFLLIKQKQFFEFFGFLMLMISFYAGLIYNKDNGETTLTHFFPLVIYFPLFYSGVLFYKLKFQKQTYFRWGLVALCFSLQLYLFDKGYSNFKALNYTQYIVVLSLFYVCFILYTHDKLKFIVNKFTIWLGSISYSLYLIHQVIGVNLIMMFLLTQLHINFTISLIIMLTCILGMAHLIYYYVEKPSIAYFRKTK